jgi:hypothetical protein
MILDVIETPAAQRVLSNFGLKWMNQAAITIISMITLISLT